jgi:acyl-CoA thioesterase YciA
MIHITTHPIKKSDLGFHGNLFGGKLLSWMDAAGAGFASEVCGTPIMVTKLIDKCIFNKPAKEGQLLKIYGLVEEVGQTSLTIKLEARSHNVYNGKQNLILSTNMIFVRVDEQGDTIPISDRVREKYDKNISPEGLKEIKRLREKYVISAEDLKKHKEKIDGRK